MSFLRRVARDVSRDIQVIIKEATGGSKPKRQRYDPAKAKKRKKYRRKPFGGNFAAKMRKKYGDQATTLNTETQRDASRLSRKSGRTSRDFEDDVRHLSLTALGRLLRQYDKRGDDEKCHIIEKEIDRRTKGFRGRGRR